MWKIQKQISKGDYVYAKVPNHPNATSNGYVLMHRVVMENMLGRLLKREEEVHHKDENGRNNEPDNLEVLSRLEHQRLHNKKRFPNGLTMVELICTYCRKDFTRRKGNVHKGNQFCSRSCNGKFYGFR